MYLRLYLDNQLITYFLNIFQKRKSNNIHLVMEYASLVYLTNIKTMELDFRYSEESLAEIRQLDDTTPKRKNLEKMYFLLKQGKSVIRNSSVLMDDPIATYNSPDVFYDHPYDDSDLNKVRKFLLKKGNKNDFDARYIANAMLPENKIDFFMTADKKSIWRHRNEIKEKFGVTVKLPSEIAEYLKYVR